MIGRMLGRLRATGLVWPTIASVVALAILVGLGTWQWRKVERRELLNAQLAARVDQPPIPFDDLLARFNGTGDIEYVRVALTGRFMHEKERHLYFGGSEGPGWHVYTPFVISGGPESPIVFVNRGYVPERLRDAGTRPGGQIEGETALVGLARRAPEDGAGWMTPANDPEANEWFSLSLGDMRASVLAGERRARVVDFFVDAVAEPANPGGYPKGGTTRMDLNSNRHFGYALTWWGLALTLIGVYTAFAYGRLSNAAEKD